MGNKAGKALSDVAMGRARADIAIVNAKLANVYTGELLENHAVTIKGKWIAYVGKRPEDNIGEDTVVIDAQGMTIIPGLIDGHTHLANWYNIAEFLRYAMKGGTTTIVTETMEVFPAAGYEGLLDFLASFRDQPVKIYGTIPANITLRSSNDGISGEMREALFERKDILGLGESFWQALLHNPDEFLPLYAAAQRCGKSVEGHSAGAKGRKLMAYAAAGVSSCHEPITAEEVLERLRLGIYVMIREGSVRRELEGIAGLLAMDVDLRRLTLVTDGIDPQDLVERGYLEFVVQKAIDLGFDPMDAVRMATLNVAEHFSLDGILGGIAPGKYADMLLIPDLKTIQPRYVISNGRIVARDGEIVVSPRRAVYAPASRRSLHLSTALKAEDFAISVSGGVSEARVRIIDQVAELVTKELHAKVPVRGGKIRVDLEHDFIKAAAIDRTCRSGRKFVGLLRGFRMRAGAFATSASWVTSNIIVVGVDDADMALAVNRLHALQGGVVVCKGGEILAELPLPVMGIISDLPMEALVEKIAGIEAAVRGLGVPFRNPCLTLATLSTAAIPYLRICEEGLVNVKEGAIRSLLME